jgi:hypothetical protein
MAIMQIQEFEVEEDDRSTTNYDSVSGRLGMEADPPAGLILHTPASRAREPSASPTSGSRRAIGRLSATGVWRRP